jgi:hypothetical protein
MGEPVSHFRDVRRELVLKLVLCDVTGIDSRALLQAQRDHFAPMVDARAATGGRKRSTADPVAGGDVRAGCPRPEDAVVRSCRR